MPVEFQKLPPSPAKNSIENEETNIASLYISYMTMNTAKISSQMKIMKRQGCRNTDISMKRCNEKCGILRKINVNNGTHTLYFIICVT